MTGPWTPDSPSSHAPQAARGLLAQVEAHVVGLLGEEDPEFVADLVETFADTSRQALADARDAGAAGDAQRLSACAHTLKGSASNIGLNALADRWTAVEEPARAGRVDAAALEVALAETATALALLTGA